MSTAINPSLGELDRLPPEIRNAIYELAIDSSVEQAKLLGRCTPYTNLAFVSKQISQEVISIINAQYKSTRTLHSTYYYVAPKCQHNTFTWVLPEEGLGESIEDWRATFHSVTDHVTCHKFETFPFTITYVTGHLHEHAPTSITLEIDPPNARTYHVNVNGRAHLRRDGCKLVSCEGGHAYVKRQMIHEVWLRVMDLQRWAIGKSTFDYSVVQACLFDVAVILQEKSLGAGFLVERMEETARGLRQKREAKRTRVILHKARQPGGAS